MMRKEAAFRFIPELIGDFSHVMELAGNPKRLYVETAINTLHAASDIFLAIEEYRNTKQKRNTKQTINEEYCELEKKRNENYVQEAAHRVDIEYATVKAEVSKGNFRDKEVRNFIKCLEEELYKTIGIFNDVQVDPDFPNREKVEEITRKALRDYNKLLTLFIEEEKNNGQTESE